MNTLNPDQALKIAEQVKKVRERIQAAAILSHRKVDEITLIAVSKTRSAQEVIAAYHAGIRDFGENYAQELVAKATLIATQYPQIAGAIRWHFIGRFQRNKINALKPHVAFWHTISSLNDAAALSQRWEHSASQPAHILLQINIGEEPQKGGVLPAQTLETLQGMIQKYPNLSVRGLMAIGPADQPAELYFARMQTLLMQIRSQLPQDMPQLLSMGMSSDFEAAIGFGATHVRVGSALFGERVASKLESESA